MGLGWDLFCGGIWSISEVSLLVIKVCGMLTGEQIGLAGGREDEGEGEGKALSYRVTATER